jgi:hypothetical protein
LWVEVGKAQATLFEPVEHGEAFLGWAWCREQAAESF